MAGEIIELPVNQRADTAEPSIDIVRYWNILFRSKWQILSFSAVICVAAYVFVSTLTPIYRATATLLIESDAANVVSIEEVYGVDSSQREYYQTQFQILNSKRLSQRVIDELSVADHPEYDLFSEKPNSLRSFLPFLPAPQPLTPEQKRTVVLEVFQSNLSIQPIRLTQLVNISFESSDPELAADVVNALGSSYIDSQLEAKLEVTQKATSWLTDRLAQMQSELEIAERALREYQEREQLVDVSGVQTLTARELEEQTRRLVETQKAVALARNQRDAAGVAGGPYSQMWESLPGVLADQLANRLKEEESNVQNEFDELAKRYGPKHPKYIEMNTRLDSARKAYESRVRKVVSGFEDKYQQALADQAAIERSLRNSKDQIQQINRKNYQLSQLQREVDTNSQLYDMFFQRFRETNQIDFAAANARFVDLASKPISPVRPRKNLIVAVVGFFAFSFAVFLVLLRSALDNTVRSAEHIEERLGRNVLGIVPLEGDMKKTPIELYFDSKHHSFSESVRSIRTSVILSGLNKNQQVITITSSLPGEGKTTISVNLAMAFGQVGSVLLIDADLRRPSLAKLFGYERPPLGLTECVAGTASIDDCIIRKENEGIDLIPAGTIPPNPLELLSSKEFESTLTQLRSRYDQIIVDTAPTQAVSDSLVLSGKSDALVYVVKADSTPVNTVRNAVRRLERIDAPIVGIVLNQFNASSAAYGYGYYGYGYASESYRSDVASSAS